MGIRHAFLTFLIAALPLLWALQDSTGGSRWLDDVDEAFAEARASGRPLLVAFR
jgi:hypothetical protein